MSSTSNSTSPDSNENSSFFPNLEGMSIEEIKKLEKRQKNNVAVKKCRIKRKQAEEETKKVVVKLREVNERMEAEYNRASAEKELLHIILPFCRLGTVDGKCGSRPLFVSSTSTTTSPNSTVKYSFCSSRFSNSPTQTLATNINKCRIYENRSF
uniref:BZIP domain-containing protein n=1 Tax=Panagrolaimus sp. JU765 TaxID=591449 RepID=A0AC34RBH2_9BILA